MKKIWSNIRQFTKKHKKLTIFLIIVLVIFLLGVYIKKQANKAMDMLNQMMSTEIAQIEKRSLVESLSATGKIVSLDSENIIAQVSGVKVKEVLCEVGDTVKAGDVICLLDTEDLEINLNNAKTNLDVSDQKSDANVAIAQRGLNESFENEAVQVDRDYEDAQLRYDDYQKALADYDKAKQEYDSAVNEYNFREAQYNEKKDAAQAKYKESRREGDPEEMDEYQLSRDPEVSYYLSKLTSAETDKNSKQKALDNAKASADKALETYNNTIRSYEDHVRNNDSAIMSKNDSLKNARLDDRTATLNSEQQTKQYEDQINECTVVAPIDGVITALNVTEGAIYSNAATIATIEDTSAYEVTAEIDEYDIAKVKEGQRVVIKTNGTGDVEYEGEVISIAPRATKSTSTSGVSQSSNVTYTVKMSITGDINSLKMDMTAKISIILSEKDGVLAVPYDAVQTDEDGRFYIEVASNDQISQQNALRGNKEALSKGNEDMPSKDVPKGPSVPAGNERIYVEKGIESDYYIEVIGDGVKEGINVVVPKKEGTNELMKYMMEAQGPMGGF